MIELNTEEQKFDVASLEFVPNVDITNKQSETTSELESPSLIETTKRKKGKYT